MNRNETKLSVSEQRVTLTKNIPMSLTHNELQQLFAMSKASRTAGVCRANAEKGTNNRDDTPALYSRPAFMENK
jgi:hypothetical protein